MRLSPKKFRHLPVVIEQSLFLLCSRFALQTSNNIKQLVYNRIANKSSGIFFQSSASNSLLDAIIRSLNKAVEK
jgi:hypothetical protein